jgi:hypothetical protein
MTPKLEIPRFQVLRRLVRERAVRASLLSLVETLTKNLALAGVAVADFETRSCLAETSDSCSMLLELPLLPSRLPYTKLAGAQAPFELQLCFLTFVDARHWQVLASLKRGADWVVKNAVLWAYEPLEELEWSLNASAEALTAAGLFDSWEDAAQTELGHFLDAIRVELKQA